jgi:hypothetical protein
MSRARWSLALLVPALLAMSAAAQPAAEGKKYVLEYKLVPGRQARGALSGTFTQKMEMRGKEYTNTSVMTGWGRTVDVAVDPETGVALIGGLSEYATEYETQGDDGKQRTSDKVSSLLAGRIDRSGRHIARDTDGEARNAVDPYSIKGSVLSRLDVHSLAGGVMPEGPVAIGDSWTYRAALPMAGLPVDCDVTSTLAEVKFVNGHECAVIHSVFAVRETGDEETGPWDAEASGTTTAVFDIENGGFIERTLELIGEIKRRRGPSVQLKLSFRSTVETVEMLSEEQLADCARVIKALDSAIDLVYADEAAGAAEALEAVIPDVKNEEWRKGLEQATTYVRSITRREPQATKAE